MKLSEEMRNNKIFTGSIVSLNGSACPDSDGIIRRAAEQQENGDWIIRISAPNAKEVMIWPWFGAPSEPNGMGPWKDEKIFCTKDESGNFIGVLKYNENTTGPRPLEIWIDGNKVVWPYLPVGWAGDQFANFVEMADPDLEFSYIKNVPHGQVVEDYYYSKATKSTERCLVYTPPGYTLTDERYPVVYLQHGGNGNETSWTNGDHVNFIMDNLIAEGKVKPFIIVMNNNMIRYHRSDIVDLCFEDSLVNSCIPHIDSTYRTKTDKWNRAIGGVSMGSMMTNDIAFHHPELFGSVGTFTSTMSDASFRTTYERPWRKTMENPEKFMKDFKVFFCSATPQEDHMECFLEDARIMEKAGITTEKMPGYRRVVHNGRFTRCASFRLGFAEYAGMLFREE